MPDRLGDREQEAAARLRDQSANQPSGFRPAAGPA
jgi:hypothetical protein